MPFLQTLLYAQETQL